MSHKDGSRSRGIAGMHSWRLEDAPSRGSTLPWRFAATHLYEKVSLHEFTCIHERNILDVKRLN